MMVGLYDDRTDQPGEPAFCRGNCQMLSLLRLLVPRPGLLMVRRLHVAHLVAGRVGVGIVERPGVVTVSATYGASSNTSDGSEDEDVVIPRESKVFHATTYRKIRL
jgi:hypothetical protein